MNKKILRILLVPFEFIFSRLNKWQPIPGSEEEIFLVDVKVFKGQNYSLSDGIIISAGDRVGELHLNNNQVKDLENSITNLYRIMDYEFTRLAESLSKEHSGIKAFYCETVLYALICRKGFQAFELPDNFVTKVKGLWFKILKDTFSIRDNPTKRERKPKICWISANKLMKRLETQ